MTDLLSLITPVNLKQEKEKFFASPNYHPVFHYIWQDNEINPNFSIKLKYPLWEAVKMQDHQSITRACSELFEVTLSESLLTQANRDSEIRGKVSGGSASEIKQLFSQAFNEFNIKYQIILSNDHGFNLRPRHGERQIIISRDIHFDYFSMEAEVHHELVHIIRYLNGKHNHIKRSQRFLPTEEGLAAWCQDNTNDDNGLAQHAMEYVASSMGIKGSLRDVFDCLCDLGMSKELAWKRACRHKFGFVDTKSPGDILKPAMYYQNEIKVGQLSPTEKLRLFVGKISLNELKEYHTYSGIWSATQLTDYFHL